MHIIIIFHQRITHKLSANVSNTQLHKICIPEIYPFIVEFCFAFIFRNGVANIFTQFIPEYRDFTDKWAKNALKSLTHTGPSSSSLSYFIIHKQKHLPIWATWLIIWRTTILTANVPLRAGDCTFFGHRLTMTMTRLSWLYCTVSARDYLLSVLLSFLFVFVLFNFVRCPCSVFDMIVSP